MEFYCKTFDELTNRQVYEILKSRTEIFLLEQDIRCQDMDDVDYQSLHCFMEEGNRVIAYLRIYYKDMDCKIVKIGRVLTLTHRNGLGRELMIRSLAIVRDKMPCEAIHVDAQVQASGYYEKMGFRQISEEFMEEGIPHILMEMKL